MSEIVFQIRYEVNGSPKAELFPFAGSPKLDDLIVAIKKKIPQCGDSLALEYKNQSGDFVAVEDDEDLTLAMTALKEQNPKIFNLKQNSSVSRDIPVDDDKPPPRSHAAPAAGVDADKSGPPPRLGGGRPPHPDPTQLSGPPPRINRALGGNTETSGAPPRVGRPMGGPGGTEQSGPPPRLRR
ncbi:hypothetical protein HDU93_009407 [Gonapodya sp. JEL0774]|nr:hypothetical protein HDU93_009407 [Gonapodya sp. JEL0774]